MKHLDLWPHVWQALDALTAHYGPAINNAAADLGIPLGQWYGWLMAARIFEPEPVSAARLHVRAAYTNPAKLEADLVNGVRLGLLEPAGAAGEYRLTAAGRAGVERLIQIAWDAMNPLTPLPHTDLARLDDLLRRVSDACLDAPEPPGKWCLRIERRYDPGPTAPVMPRLDQHLSDLVAYRDDARIAVRQAYGVSGPAWEASGLLWRGAAMTLDEISDRLARRGWSKSDYANAIQELLDRGWVAGNAAFYAVTAQGRKVREEAFATREAYFYAPWRVLSDAELAELAGLLERLAAALAQA